MRLYRSYNKVCSGKIRRSPTQLNKEANFKQLMREVFAVESETVVRQPTKKKTMKKHDTSTDESESNENDEKDPLDVDDANM